MGEPNIFKRISGYVFTALATTTIATAASAFSNVNPLEAQPKAPADRTPVTNVKDLQQPVRDVFSDGTENNIPQPTLQTDALRIDQSRETPVQALESDVNAAAEASENAEKQTRKDEEPKQAESNTNGYLETRAAEWAEKLQALQTNNLKNVTQIMGDAQQATNASGLNLNLTNFNPNITIGHSMPLGDGRIGATVATGTDGANAQLAYENGRFAATAQTGTNGSSLNAAYRLEGSPALPALDLNTIGSKTNPTIDAYSEQHRQSIDMANILNTAFNVQGQR